MHRARVDRLNTRVVSYHTELKPSVWDSSLFLIDAARAGAGAPISTEGHEEADTGAYCVRQVVVTP